VGHCQIDCTVTFHLYGRLTADDTWGTYDRGIGEQRREIMESTGLSVQEKAMALYSLEAASGRVG